MTRVKWTFRLLNLGLSIAANRDQNRMANSVDPDETVPYEPSHQDLHFLHMYLVWSAGLKGIKVSKC